VAIVMRFAQTGQVAAVPSASNEIPQLQGTLMAGTNSTASKAPAKSTERIFQQAVGSTVSM